MHYYQHHIGDFVRDTSRLSDAQSMAYLRLLWAYYDKEQPLANSVEKLAFQIGASEKDVGLILEHFFKLDTEENVWRHKRCDAEIEAYKAKEEKARKSANARWGNKSSASKAQKTSSKDAQTVQPQCERNANASKSDANQEPITNNQEPITNTKGEVLETSRVHTREEPPAPIPKTFPDLVDDFVQPPPKATATMYGATCIALKAAGVPDVAPGNLEFRALVDAGIGIDVFTEVAAKAVATGKGRFKYVIAAVNGQIKDAQATAAAAKSATPLRAIAGGKAAAYQSPLKATDAAAETEKARRMLFGGTPPDDPNTVDVDARFVGDVKGVAYA